MATLFVRHQVADFAAWKAAYDAFAANRRQMGVTGDGVYQTENDPNDVTVYHHFESGSAAKAFVDSEALQRAMQEAGVLGNPNIWLTRRVEAS